MNAKQEKAYKLCVAGHRCLITGKCGSGKSHVIREIVQQLRKQQKNIAVAATTGLAAMQFKELNATTLHKWANIGTMKTSPDEIIERMDNDAKHRITKTEILIVDEIGMLSAATFDCIDYICRKVRNTNNIFGGIQLICVGDFYQLPPVPNMKTPAGDSGQYCFESDLFRKCMSHHVHFDTIIRQSEPCLAQAVDELICGRPTSSTEQLMLSLSRPLDVSDPPPIILAGTNFSVDMINYDHLSNYCEENSKEMFKYTAIDTGNKKSLKKSPAEKVLNLCEGAPVILLRNLSESFVNGMRGTVIKGANGPVVDFGGSVLKLEKYEFREQDACRLQYPIKLAYAITVHRAQGQTLNTVLVDCSDFFQPAQLGVAVGRATSTNRLQVLNYSTAAATFDANSKVQAFMDYLSTGVLEVTDTCCTAECLEPLETAVVEVPTTSAEKLSETHVELPPEHVRVLQGLDDIIIAELPKNENAVLFMREVSDFVDTQIEALRQISQKNDKAKSQATASIFKDVHTFLTAETFADMCFRLFEGQPSKIQRKLCTKIGFAFIEYKIAMLGEEVAGSASDNDSTDALQYVLPEVLPPTLRSKIRYVAGATVAKVSYRHKALVKRKMYKSKPTSIKEDNIKQIIFAQLKSSETQVMQESLDQESLCETQSRQGITRGLTNVTDNTYEFFIELYRKLYSLGRVNVDFVQGRKSATHVSNIVTSDPELVEHWLNIFSTTSLPCDDEDLCLSLQFAIFEEVVFHFTKIWCSELLKNKKSEICQKQQALRSDLKAQKKRKLDKAEQKVACSTSDSTHEAEDEVNLVYNCAFCGEVCIDKPECVEEDSICCDKCNKWHHYKCVGITGKEKFLANTSSKWFCNDCKKLTATKTQKGRKSSKCKK